jgi:hypothetical protein
MKMGVQPSYINVICEGLFKLHEISLFLKKIVLHVCLMQCIFSSNAFPFFDKKLGKIGMFSSNVNSTSFAKLL